MTEKISPLMRNVRQMTKNGDNVAVNVAYFAPYELKQEIYLEISIYQRPFCQTERDIITNVLFELTSTFEIRFMTVVFLPCKL